MTLAPPRPPQPTRCHLLGEHPDNPPVLDHLGFELPLHIPQTLFGTIGPLLLCKQPRFQIGNLLAHRCHKHFRHTPNGGQKLFRPPFFSPVGLRDQPAVDIVSTAGRRHLICWLHPVDIGRQPLVAISATVGRQSVCRNKYSRLTSNGVWRPAVPSVTASERA